MYCFQVLRFYVVAEKTSDIIAEICVAQTFCKERSNTIDGNALKYYQRARVG